MCYDNSRGMHRMCSFDWRFCRRMLVPCLSVSVMSMWPCGSSRNSEEYLHGELRGERWGWTQRGGSHGVEGRHR